jgi:hypothetical protein
MHRLWARPMPSFRHWQAMAHHPRRGLVERRLSVFSRLCSPYSGQAGAAKCSFCDSSLAKAAHLSWEHRLAVSCSALLGCALRTPEDFKGR